MTSPLRSFPILLVLAAIGACGTQEVDPKAATCASENADPGTCTSKEPELGDTMLQRGSGRSQTTVTEDDYGKGDDEDGNGDDEYGPPAEDGGDKGDDEYGPPSEDGGDKGDDEYGPPAEGGGDKGDDEYGPLAEGGEDEGDDEYGPFAEGSDNDDGEDKGKGQGTGDMSEDDWIPQSVLETVQNKSDNHADDDDEVDALSILEIVAVENMSRDAEDEEADVSEPKEDELKEKAVPKVFGKKGEYFGFGNKAANTFFGTKKWNKQTYDIDVDGKVVQIKVWKDNKNCKMSCGRRVDKKIGSWQKGKCLHKVSAGITKPFQEESEQNLKLWASASEEKPAGGWPVIVALNGNCQLVVSVAACAEPLVPYKKVQTGAGSQKVVKWLEVVVPWMRVNYADLGINKKRVGVMGYSWAGTVSFVFAAGLFGTPKKSQVNGILLVSCGKGITQFPSYFDDKGLLNGRGKPNTFLVECKQRSEYAPTLKLYNKLKKAGFASTLKGYECAKKNEFAAGAGLPWHYPQGEPQFLDDLHSWITTKFT